jgi:hypothetical protein
MTQQINNQNKQSADCQEHAGPEHNVADNAVSLVINTAPPNTALRCPLPVPITSPMPK